MVNKKPIKQSEAKILIYLSVVHNSRKHVTAIANKLEIDYSYVMRILQAMTAKGWLRKHQVRRHMFYYLTEKAPLEMAQNEYLSGPLQTDLMNSDYMQEELLPQPEVSDENPNNEQVL